MGGFIYCMVHAYKKTSGGKKMVPSMSAANNNFNPLLNILKRLEAKGVKKKVQNT